MVYDNLGFIRMASGSSGITRMVSDKSGIIRMVLVISGLNFGVNFGGRVIFGDNLEPFLGSFLGVGVISI